MGHETIQTTRIYRALLKSLEKNIGKDGERKRFRELVTQEFKKNTDLTNQTFIQQKLKFARDYTFLLNSVHQHKELLFSYNIAVDRSDEMKKILGKSAASVGLRLPESYQP